MAQITICDICGSDKDVDLIRFITGQTHNGVDYDDDITIYDLCEKCQLKMYRVYFKLINEKRNQSETNEYSKKLLKIIKNMEK